MKRIIKFFTASIQRKILFSFAILIMLVVGMIVGGYYQLSQVSLAAEEVIPASSQMGALQTFALTISSLEANLERLFVIGGFESEEAILADQAKLAAALDNMAANATAESKPQVDALQEAAQNLAIQINGMVEAKNTAKLSSRELNEEIISVYAKINAIKALYETLTTTTLNQLQTNAIAQAGISSNIMIQFLVLGTLVVLIVVGASVVVTRSIAVPLASLAETATRIAEGDLEAQVPVITQDDEVGQLAVAFNRMTNRLRGLIDTLEVQVQQRTQALETSADISHQLIAIMNIDDLLKYVVNRIQTEFGFYHTHIYLIEAETGDLVMTEGSGEVGRQLKEKGHRLPAGHGIVGTVAALNEHFLSNNVNEVLNFVRNPLLPDTNAELAVPLRKGELVLGVLDIQSEQLNRFTPEDVSLMQAIANQTAVALDNVRLLKEAQEALQEVERLNHRLTREAWQESSQELAAVGYRFSKGNIQPLTDPSSGWLSPLPQAASHKQLAKPGHPGNGGERAKAELAVPLILRGEVIGVLGLKREENPDWTAEEVAVVETVADQVSRALENARLSKEQEKTIIQLKDIDRLKSEFLTSMSHELRTPLNSIIGFADVLLQGIDGELNDLAMGDIQLIHNSGKHLLALINDILDLSKIEAGKMDLVREALNVHEIIESVLASSNSLVKDKPVEMRVDAAEGLPPVYADKLRLNQILLNLVSNAAKFTHKGSITINARLDESAPGYMRLAIIDTGIGIPESKLGAIFERFRQADMTTTRQYGGTGLGLAICRQLIEMHGGNIQVTSQEKVGSEFFFTIPLA